MGESDGRRERRAPELAGFSWPFLPPLAPAFPALAEATGPVRLLNRQQ